MISVNHSPHPSLQPDSPSPSPDCGGTQKDDWKRAHESAQQDERMEGSWVHTYPHRNEGDQGNAAYWYSRAGKPVCREPIDAEWVSRNIFGEFAHPNYL